MFNKTVRDDMYEPCGNILKKSRKECPNRKLKGRKMCRRCLDRKRQAEDPLYRAKRQKGFSRTKRCPGCGGGMSYSAVKCQGCATNHAVPWNHVAVLYSYRNPDDPLTEAQVKGIGDGAMQKIRKLLATPNDTPLSDALMTLQEDTFG